MTRIVMLAFFLTGALAAFAQTSKGTISLGGLVSASTGTSKALGVERESTSVTIAPGAGFFVADNMELGMNLFFGYGNDKADGDDLTSSRSAGLEPYFKYYLFTNNERFAFTLNAAMTFGFTKRDNPPDSFYPDATGKNFGISFSPGFSYFFTDKIGLDFELQGIMFSYSDPNNDTDDDEGTYLTIGAASLNPSLGFKYYFAR